MGLMSRRMAHCILQTTIPCSRTITPGISLPTTFGLTNLCESGKVSMGIKFSLISNAATLAGLRPTLMLMVGRYFLRELR